MSKEMNEKDFDQVSGGYYTKAGKFYTVWNDKDSSFNAIFTDKDAAKKYSEEHGLEWKKHSNWAEAATQIGRILNKNSSSNDEE